jgi:hypothetical protein
MLENDRELDVVQFLRAHYIRWAVGQLDCSMAEVLDALSPVGWENWKTTLERVNGYDPTRLRDRHTLLCDSLGFSNEEALNLMLRAE